MRQELSRAKQEFTISQDAGRRHRDAESERETMYRNEYLSNELLMAKSRSIHQE